MLAKMDGRPGDTELKVAKHSNPVQMGMTEAFGSDQALERISDKHPR